MNKCCNNNDSNMVYLNLGHAIQFDNDDSNLEKYNDTEKVDINTEEKENVKELQKYQQYQEY